MKKDGVKMYVDPSFRTFVKIKCAQTGKTMVDFTREMADYPSKSIIQEEQSIDAKQRRPFSFKL